MWFTRKLKEKQEARNTACECLLLQIRHALAETDALFANADTFISPEQVSVLGQKYRQTLSQATPDAIKTLRKAAGFKNLQECSEKLRQSAQLLASKVQQHNEQIIRNQIQMVSAVIGDVEGKQLDPQQLLCIAKDVHNHLVIAGAGTGKTTTVIGKIKYLLKTQKYRPEEILVLSFTNASAAEMRERIEKETGCPIAASTFHKLGLQILAQADGIKPTITSLQMRKFIAAKLSEFMQDASYLKQLTNYCMMHRVSMKSEFDFTSQKEYREYLRSNPPMTLKQETVKSYGEMEIANFLYQNGIEYIYEHPYEQDTRTEDFGQYHPDFYLPEYGIYLEYFGIDRNGNPPDYFEEGYVESMKWKRELHKQNRTTMIECYAYENMEGTLLDNLQKRLTEHLVALHPQSPEEIWQKIKEENHTILDGLLALFETLINLIKSNHYTIQDVEALNHNHPKSRENGVCLALLEPIYDAYCSHLTEHHEIDFNDMINLAAVYVREGKYHNPYKMVIVDEYQDISKARFNLLKALRESADYALFCVGDDWQSIYRFAGSDIGFIQNFSEYWGATELSRIETTYRFPQTLIDVSGDFIMKNPRQIRKSIKGHSQQTAPALGEVNGYTEKYALQFMAQRLEELPQNSIVFFIGRYGFDVKILDSSDLFTYQYDNVSGVIRVVFQKRKDLHITFLTAHKSKGLQADYVYILNNKNDRMGFPSKVEDAPILSLLLEHCDLYPYAEERRLFYVALTRAKKCAVLVTVKDKESEFVKELRASHGDLLRQEAFACPKCGGKLQRRSGPYGEFWGCANYRVSGCKFTRKIGRKN